MADESPASLPGLRATVHGRGNRSRESKCWPGGAGGRRLSSEVVTEPGCMAREGTPPCPAVTLICKVERPRALFSPALACQLVWPTQCLKCLNQLSTFFTVGGYTPVWLSSFSASLPGCGGSWTELSRDGNRTVTSISPTLAPICPAALTQEISWLRITQPGKTELGLLPLASKVQPRNRTLLRQGAVGLGVPWRVYSRIEAVTTCIAGLWQPMEGLRAGLSGPRCEAPGRVAYGREMALLGLMGLRAPGVGGCPVGWPVCTG